ncbi:hypothetical protein VPHD480_0049 [Vibrio phage D480]
MMYFPKRIKTPTTKNVPLKVGTKLSVDWKYVNSLVQNDVNLELIYESDTQYIFLDLDSNLGATFSMSRITGDVHRTSDRRAIFNTFQTDTGEPIVIERGQLCVAVDCVSEEKMQYTPIKRGDTLRTHHYGSLERSTAVVLFVTPEFITVESNNAPFTFSRSEIIRREYSYIASNRGCKIDTEIFCGIPEKDSIAQ